MLVLDFREDAAPPEADVVVIGSGPAGMTLAAELTRAGREVLVIESGPDADELNHIENVGAPRTEPQGHTRRREVGGSSTRWSGRCTPLDDIDFEKRSWVPASGWPITPGELTPHLERAAQIFQLGEQEYGDGVWSLLGRKAPEPPLDRTRVVTRFWQFSRGRNRPTHPTRFATDIDNGATVLSAATVTRLVERGGSIVAVEVTSTTGARATIAAGTVVLAGGAIENPRLLLASGLGNDNTGRYLMDHPGAIIASIQGKDSERVRDRFGFYWRPATPYRLSYLHGFALAPEVQREEHLLNVACWLDEFASEDDPWQAGIRLLRGRRTAPVASVESAEYWRAPSRKPVPRGKHVDLWNVVRHPIVLADGYLRMRRNRPPLYLVDRVDLYSIVEQVPDPESRVTLSDRVDPLGVPLPRVDWRLHDEEHRAMARLLELVSSELERVGLPAPVPAPWMADAASWRARVIDRAHQIGTTRMAASPADGVVDTDCRLFGVDNLYVAGSSVFPTAGHANPTLMIVALAIRLADHLIATTGRETAPATAVPSTEAA